MSDCENNQPVDIASAVKLCTAEFLAELSEIYASVDADIARTASRCDACGKCCMFDLADHRLYLSTGELAMLTMEPPPDIRPAFIRRCPYQVDTKCTARNRRSLGCRVFFCGKKDTENANQYYETYHSMIRMLHQKHCVPYAYAELTEALLQLFAKT